MKYLIIILILLALVLPATAQEPRAIDCVGAVSPLRYVGNNGEWLNWVSDSTTQQLYALTGDEFFIEATKKQMVSTKIAVSLLTVFGERLSG